jgi:hypothetical protein
VKPAAAPSTAAADPVRDRHARRLGFLHRLAKAGMEQARGLFTRVTARVTEDFERLAKAIRLAILLRRRLEEVGPGFSTACPAPPSRAPTEDSDPSDRPEPTELGEAIARLSGAGREPRERTGDPWLDRDDDTELDTLPVAVLVQRLCEILDVPYDPDLWADAIAPIGAEGSPGRVPRGRAAPNRILWREPPTHPLRSPADPRPPLRPSG